MDRFSDDLFEALVEVSSFSVGEMFTLTEIREKDMVSGIEVTPSCFGENETAPTEPITTDQSNSWSLSSNSLLDRTPTTSSLDEDDDSLNDICKLGSFRRSNSVENYNLPTESPVYSVLHKRQRSRYIDQLFHKKQNDPTSTSAPHHDKRRKRKSPHLPSKAMCLVETIFVPKDKQSNVHDEEMNEDKWDEPQPQLHSTNDTISISKQQQQQQDNDIEIINMIEPRPDSMLLDAAARCFPFLHRISLQTNQANSLLWETLTASQMVTIVINPSGLESDAHFSLLLSREGGSPTRRAMNAFHQGELYNHNQQYQQQHQREPMISQSITGTATPDFFAMVGQLLTPAVVATEQDFSLRARLEDWGKQLIFSPKQTEDKRHFDIFNENDCINDLSNLKGTGPSPLADRKGNGKHHHLALPTNVLDSPSNHSTATSTATSNLLQDTDLRTLMQRTRHGDNADQLFPSISSDSMDTVDFSDDGLQDEIGALGCLEHELRRELESAEMFAEGLRRPKLPTRTSTGGSNNNSNHPATTIREETETEPNSTSTTAIIDHPLHPEVLSEEEEQGESIVPSHQRRRVRFADVNQEHYYIVDDISDDEDSSGSIDFTATLEEFYTACGDLIDGMSMACVNAVHRARPRHPGPNNGTVCRGSTIFYY